MGDGDSVLPFLGSLPRSARKNLASVPSGYGQFDVILVFAVSLEADYGALLDLLTETDAFPLTA